MSQTILSILGSLLYVIVCVGVPVGIILWVHGLCSKPEPEIPCKRLWQRVRGTCRSQTQDKPSKPLADRYKALVEQREAARNAAQELQNRGQIVVNAHLKEILAIVKSETGIELDVTTEFRDLCGFRCDFAVGNTAVSRIWMSFDGASTTLDRKTQSALPSVVAELVDKTKIACPFTAAK